MNICEFFSRWKKLALSNPDLIASSYPDINMGLVCDYGFRYATEKIIEQVMFATFPYWKDKDLAFWIRRARRLAYPSQPFINSYVSWVYIVLQIDLAKLLSTDPYIGEQTRQDLESFVAMRPSLLHPYRLEHMGVAASAVIDFDELAKYREQLIADGAPRAPEMEPPERLYFEP